MLHYNIGRIFKARNIENPYSWLVKHGLSPNLAHRVANNKLDRLALHHMETICVLLHCTPNDLIDWSPKDKKADFSEHPLSGLQKEYKFLDFKNLVKKIPLEKMDELEQMLKEFGSKGKKKEEG